MSQIETENIKSIIQGMCEETQRIAVRELKDEVLLDEVGRRFNMMKETLVSVKNVVVEGEINK